jgi:rhomboid protease GluP
MIHDELMDLRKRNQKNIEAFVAAFRAVGDTLRADQLVEWQAALDQLRIDTLKAAEEEYKTAQEIEKVMNFSKSNLYVTYAIIGINALVYLAMVYATKTVINFTAVDTIIWGANYAPLTLSGDWWRLLSSVFVHGGLIHIALNMYALYMAGTYLEPMLGKVKYISAYLCAGICASLTSLWWHKEAVPSVGASGAIFGLYGLFLAFLTTNFRPSQIRKGLLPSILVFVAFNLLFGVQSGIDNAAHIGGVISGFIIGYLFYFSMKGEKKPFYQSVAVAIVVVVTIGLAYLFLQKNQQPASVRANTMNYVSLYRSKDGERYTSIYQQIAAFEDMALSPLRNSSLTDQQLLDSLINISAPKWEAAAVAAEKLENLSVPDKAKREAETLFEYLLLRKEENSLRIKRLSQNDPAIDGQLKDVSDRIQAVSDRLDKIRNE